MDEFLPYSRTIDRMVYGYTYSRIVFGKIVQIMGWNDDGMKQFTGYHKHAKAYEVENTLGSSIFESYYKFAFVRNPFDWLVSLYFYILQDKNHREHEVVVSMNFLEFLKWHLSNNPPHQLDFVMDPNRSRRLVDYIGRFETLTKDIAVIKENLRLEVTNSIKHKNPSLKRKSKDYQGYYDDEGRDLVLDYFQSDFHMLGYDFCGVREDIPLMQKF